MRATSSSAFFGLNHATDMNGLQWTRIILVDDLERLVLRLLGEASTQARQGPWGVTVSESLSASGTDSDRTRDSRVASLSEVSAKFKLAASWQHHTTRTKAAPS